MQQNYHFIASHSSTKVLAPSNILLTMNRRPSSAEVIAQNIKILMAKHGLSQAALGRKAGVAQTLLSGLLSREDGIKNPQSSTIDKIATAFGIEPWKLLLPEADLQVLEDRDLESLVSGFLGCDRDGRASILRTTDAELRYASVNPQREEKQTG